MKNYNGHYYIPDLKAIMLCGELVAFEGSISKFELPKPIKATKGQHDFQKCDNCQTGFKMVLKGLENKYKNNSPLGGFPYCCSKHINLITEVEGFEKEMFVNAPLITAQKIYYSYQHILNNQNKDNWKEEITDYLDYVIESFGEMPTNCGCPLFSDDFIIQVEHLVKNNSDIKPEIINYALEYFENLKSPQLTSLQELASYYEKWFNSFPFNLSLYKDLKPLYQTRIPILKGEGRLNKYNNKVYFSKLNLDDLNELLLEQTNTLLKQVSSLSIAQKNDLESVNLHQLELAFEQRRLKLNSGYRKPEKQLEYQIMIEDWLKDEQEFLDKIAPLLKPKAELYEAKTEVLKEKLTSFGFFELPSTKQLNPVSQNQLIKLINDNGLPYAIAMFEHLGFIEHITKNHSTNKDKRNKLISSWFESDKQGRSVKGNIAVLNPRSNENKDRYTAHLHKVSAKKDFENLK